MYPKKQIEEEAKSGVTPPDKLETARVVLEMLAYIATVASLVWQIVKG